MSKLKDTLLLLFWGIIAGAFFVGCILGFMYVWNHAHEWLKLASIQSPHGHSRAVSGYDFTGSRKGACFY